jgi:hypothetical protein
MKQIIEHGGHEGWKPLTILLKYPIPKTHDNIE